MRTGFLFPAAALLAAVAATAFPPAGAAGGTAADPHAHFRLSGQCPQCHAHAGSTLAADRFVSGADAVCLGCHPDQAPGRSHPRNVRPGEGLRTVRPPEDYRLDEQGRILCLTCHRGHGRFLSPVRAFAGQRPEAPGPHGEPGGLYRTYYLRRSDPADGFAPLCRGCHPLP